MIWEYFKVSQKCELIRESSAYLEPKLGLHVLGKNPFAYFLCQTQERLRQFDLEKWKPLNMNMTQISAKLVQ